MIDFGTSTPDERSSYHYVGKSMSDDERIEKARLRDALRRDARVRNIFEEGLHARLIREGHTVAEAQGIFVYLRDPKKNKLPDGWCKCNGGLTCCIHYLERLRMSV